MTGRAQCQRGAAGATEHGTRSLVLGSVLPKAFSVGNGRTSRSYRGPDFGTLPLAPLLDCFDPSEKGLTVACSMHSNKTGRGPVIQRQQGIAVRGKQCGRWQLLLRAQFDQGKSCGPRPATDLSRLFMSGPPSLSDLSVMSKPFARTTASVVAQSFRSLKF